MHDDEIIDHLDLMLESIQLIDERFSRVRSAKDFVLSSEGTTLLDAVSMRLQVIGESVKKIQKLDPSFLNRYRSIEWDKIARFRDMHRTTMRSSITRSVTISARFIFQASKIR